MEQPKHLLLELRLCKLGKDDLKFLKQMPNVQGLTVRIEVLPREPVAITGGGFPKLETLYVDSRLPRAITFEKRAMPKLKHLEFKFYTGTTRQDYAMGIKNLESLEKVVFRCTEYYSSCGPGISSTIDDVRKEATEHPNEIILCVNDMRPEVFRRGANGINLKIMAIVEKEIEEWENETENRKREIEEKAERICEQRHRLLTALDRRAEREKKNAVIEKDIRDQFALFLERKPKKWAKETRKREIEERVGRARDQSLQVLTEAERPAEWKKNNAEIKNEIQDTIHILEKSSAENMKKKQS